MVRPLKAAHPLATKFEPFNRWGNDPESGRAANDTEDDVQRANADLETPPLLNRPRSWAVYARFAKILGALFEPLGSWAHPGGSIKASTVPSVVK
jgi:hypothetical protein